MASTAFRNLNSKRLSSFSLCISQVLTIHSLVEFAPPYPKTCIYRDHWPLSLERKDPPFLGTTLLFLSPFPSLFYVSWRFSYVLLVVAKEYYLCYWCCLLDDHTCPCMWWFIYVHVIMHMKKMQPLIIRSRSGYCVSANY